MLLPPARERSLVASIRFACRSGPWRRLAGQAGQVTRRVPYLLQPFRRLFGHATSSFFAIHLRAARPVFPTRVEPVGAI
jgi:hypothetical protein